MSDNLTVTMDIEEQIKSVIKNNVYIPLKDESKQYDTIGGIERAAKELKLSLFTEEEMNEAFNAGKSKSSFKEFIQRLKQIKQSIG